MRISPVRQPVLQKLPWMSIEYEKQHLEGKLVALMVYFNQLCWGN